jgi:hypothetical protein
MMRTERSASGPDAGLAVGVGDDDEAPGLAVARARGAGGGPDQLLDELRLDRVGFEVANGSGGAHGFEGVHRGRTLPASVFRR